MTDQQAQATPKPQKAAQVTDYVVLHRVSDLTESNREIWGKAGHAKAVNAQAAIKSVAGKDEGTFIAVPARSWKPLTRKIEKVERDLWS